MPPTVSHYRPQTSKAAKKAYRKSGATVRLSASELAVIERRAVLQERADRIKERELRRKANIKRRDERNQRERDARHRMGIPSPAENTKGIRVGPSQLHLGDFMGLGKRRTDEEMMEEKDAESMVDRNEDFPGMGPRGCQMSPRPWRNPLQIISANSTYLPKPSIGTTKALGSSSTEGSPTNKSEASMEPPPSQRQSRFIPTSPVDGQTALPEIKKVEEQMKKEKISERAQTIPIGTRPTQTSASPVPAGLTTKQEVPAENSECKVPSDRKMKSAGRHSTPMGPPPLPKPMKPTSTVSTSQEMAPPILCHHKPPDRADESLDDFFVSNTQIGRELSPPPIERASTILPPSSPNQPRHPTPSIHLRLPPPNDEPSYLLDLLCTQDLDFSNDLTQTTPLIPNDDTTTLLAQISTEDLDFSTILTQATPRNNAESLTSSFDLEKVQPIPNLDIDVFESDGDTTEEDPDDLSTPFTPTIPAPAPATESFEFDPDVTESDLEDLVLEFELESTAHSSHHTTTSARQESVEEAQIAAECEAFDFSTQELRELGV
ncbi:hypothetical protein P7C71_g5210, partial [Lecanoromycetidae sp. Uapishka_2]